MKGKLLYLTFVFLLFPLFANAETALNEKLNNTLILYNPQDQTTTADNSSQENTGTETDGTWSLQTAKFQVGDKALVNVEDTATITYPNINAYESHNLTVSLWSNISLSDTAVDRGVISARDTDTAPFWFISANAEGNTWQLFMRFNSAENRVSVQPDMNAYKGTMTFITMVINNTNSAASNAWIYVYANDTEIATGQINAGGGTDGA